MGGPKASAYRDPARPIAERIENLLEQMTLGEKLAQLGCVWSTQLVENDSFSLERARELLRDGTGHVTRIGASTGLRPNESAAFANAIQRFLVDESRLGIPALVHEEGCAGFTARDATQFPQAIGLASTWDPELALEMGRVIREQMLAVGARQVLAPVLDIARDPRWGRTEETYGEDPYLAGRLGVAYVKGIQGDDLRRGVVATGKHFLGYGFTEGGLNHSPAHMGPREMREIFARPFEAAIREAGLASVMNAYNEIDGLACGGSRAILDDLLRGELGFDGVVVADYFAVRLLRTFHNVAADKGDAAKMALEAGLDVELPVRDSYGEPLRERVENGSVALETVDRSVARMLRMKLELGLFEDPYVDEQRAVDVYDTAEQRALAREIARKSIVLLKNEGDLLPLDPGLQRLALIGPSVDDGRLMQGDYHYPAHLEMIYEQPGAQAQASADPTSEGDILPRSDAVAFAPGPYFVPMVTLAEGVRGVLAELGSAAEVQLARGCGISGDDRSGIAAAAECARNADVAVVAVGGKSGLTFSCTSGEFRDAADLGLTGVQQELVEAVVATGTPTVVVLIGGRSFALPWIALHVPALVEAWLPGEEGGAALAEILFGVANPSGRLPVTVVRSVGQVPLYYNHKSGGGRSQMLGDYSDSSTSPLFAFGHGLSYTHFEYGELDVSYDAARGVAGQVRVAIEITNAGRRSGEEVVQLYVRDPVASVTRPVKQLAGFVRVSLQAAESRRVSFQLDLSQLAFYDAEMNFVIEPGEIEVFVGRSSADLPASGSFVIPGETRRIATHQVVATRVEIS